MRKITLTVQLEVDSARDTSVVRRELIEFVSEFCNKVATHESYNRPRVHFEIAGNKK